MEARQQLLRLLLPPFAGLVHSCLRPLSLQPCSRVARRCPPSFRPFGGTEAEAPLGYGVVPDLLFLFFPQGEAGSPLSCVDVCGNAWHQWTLTMHDI
jgi:hypothetical protein